MKLNKIPFFTAHLNEALKEVQLLANYPKCPHIIEYKNHWFEYCHKDQDNEQAINDESISERSDRSSSEIDLHSSDLVTIGDLSSSPHMHDKTNIPTYLYIQQELCAMTLSQAINRIHSELIPGKN